MHILPYVVLIVTPSFLGWIATKLDPDDQLLKTEEYDMLLIGACFLIGVTSLFGAKLLIFQALSLLSLMMANLLLLEMIAMIIFFKAKIPTRIPWLY